MRTAIDIIDRLLDIAGVRARKQGVSLGTVLSDPMSRGLELPRRRSTSGFPVLEAPAGAPVVTDELVGRHRDVDA